MRPQAAEIRIHNAQISNYQGMLGGLSAAESGERRSQVQITYNKIENRWQTMIINKQSIFLISASFLVECITNCLDPSAHRIDRACG
jgi:hypothetical protein